jgi:hypothetical protein
VPESGGKILGVAVWTETGDDVGSNKRRNPDGFARRKRKGLRQRKGISVYVVGTLEKIEV